MNFSISRVLAVLALALLTACGSTKDDFSQQAVDKLYADAKDEMNSGGYDRAVKMLERVEGRAAGTLLAQQATLDLAYCHYRMNDRTEAIAALDRFARLNPSSPAFDYSLYLRGIINFNDNLGFLGGMAKQNLSERDQQASRDSYQALKQLVDQFPDSRYAPDARVRMDYIVNALSEYEVHVARYYYRRGAFVAAANRAQTAVTEYRQTPAIEEALYIMTVSYDKLGLTQLRDDSERVLRANFPNSKYLSEGIKEGKSWWNVW